MCRQETAHMPIWGLKPPHNQTQNWHCIVGPLEFRIKHGNALLSLTLALIALVD